MSAVMSEGPDMDVLIRGICALGLPNAIPLPRHALDDVAWNSVVATVKSERIEGLLVEAVRSGELIASEEQIVSVRELGWARAQVDLRLERECLHAAAALDGAKVPWRLVKGPALAHVLYRDPSLRGYGDIDLLVRPDAWRRCVEALEAAGATRLAPELRSGFDERFGKDATFASPGNAQIDLHRGLVFGPYGFWVNVDELFDRTAQWLTLAGRLIPTISPEDSFLYACYSVALADDPPRLAAVRDVAEMAYRSELDTRLLLSTARRWKGVAVVRSALELVAMTLGVDLSDTTVWQQFATGASSLRERALIASYRGPGRGYTSQLAGVVALPGVREKVLYIRALAFPQKSYLAARGVTSRGFIRNAMRRIRGRA